MKLAYILGSYGVVSETFIRDLAEGLDRAGEQLTIICNDVRSDGPPAPGQAHAVGFGSLLERQLRLPRIALRALGPRGERMTVELQHWLAANRLEEALGRVAPEAAYVDYGFNAIHALRGLQAKRIPFVVHFHGIDASAMLHEPIYARNILQVFDGAYRIIVPSAHLRRRLVVAGCPSEKLRVIPYAPDLERFSPGDWSLRRQLPPTIVAVGRLVDKKCPLALIRAFGLAHREVPAAKLVIIGDGPLMPACRELISQLQLEDAVELRGRQSSAEVAKALAEAWIFGQHSVTAGNGDQEGLPVAILEACARSLPVVATYHSGIREQVMDGETGYLVHEYDFEAMAERFVQLLSDSERCERLGHAGRAQLESRCHPETRLNAIRQLLHDAISQRGAA